GIGVQFKGATAHLEQIQRVVQELLRYGPRPEGAVIQRAARGAPDPGSYISARIGILQVESNHRRWIEAQALLVSLGKFLARCLIEQQRGFKIRAGQRILDPANPLTQVEPL